MFSRAGLAAHPPEHEEAASAPAVSPPVQPATGRDARGSYRFPDAAMASTMTADQFDARMRANGIRRHAAGTACGHD